jgi:hypothetical protein
VKRILVLALALAGCHRKAATSVTPPPPVVPVTAADAVREQALLDLQNDLIMLRAQLGVMANQLIAAAPPTGAGAGASASPHAAAKAGAALYTCERLQIAGRALADDARAQSALGEADALCSYHAPLIAGEQQLAALESAHGAEAPRSAPSDCGPIRDALGRVGAKYKNDARLADLIKRFKSDCPHMRLAAARAERAAPSSSRGGPAVDFTAQRDACRRRCDDASFECRSRCQYCGSCTSDKTSDWCEATCNNCRQGCEQNERFCQAGCGS